VRASPGCHTTVRAGPHTAVPIRRGPSARSEEQSITSACREVPVRAASGYSGHVGRCCWHSSASTLYGFAWPCALPPRPGVGSATELRLSSRGYFRRLARPLRVQFPGALYQVTARGSERKPIFRDERDRPAQVRKYLSQYLSARAQARSAWRSATAACALSVLGRSAPPTATSPPRPPCPTTQNTIQVP